MRWSRWLVLFLLLVSGCDSCRRSGGSSGGFTFAKGADRAAALPWQPWSADILARAKAEKKPVLVSFVSTLCERCDLLDRTTLADERVAEVLDTKFVLVRAHVDAEPTLAARLADGFPSLVALDTEGSTVWQANYLQPGALNQALYQILRGELPVKLAAERPRYQPAALEPLAVYAFNLGDFLVGKFDPLYRGYTSPKRLATEWMSYELLLGGLEFHDPAASQRFKLHLGGLWEGAHEPRDGGFLTGAVNADWRAALPIKYADEQAEMAEVIAQLNAFPWWHHYLERPITDYTDAADKAVEYLQRRLIDHGRVFTGEMADLDYYRGGAGAGPVRDETARTDIAGRTAAALARGGTLLARPAWIKLAGEIADRSLQERRGTGLFYHVPAASLAPDRLEDAAAMFDAVLALYEATGDERWLTEGRALAKALAPLHAEGGYFVDVTEPNGFPPEALPAANITAARALWRLGAIDDDARMRIAAFDIVRAFAGNPNIFGEQEGLFALAVWDVTGPFVRYELPRAWRERPDAGALIRNPQLGRFIRWTDAPQGRVCDAQACGPFGDKPGELAAQAAARFTTPRF